MIINKRYRLIKKIGEGRSVVFLAEDLLISGSMYAIKVLAENSSIEEKETFRNEFLLLKSFNHRNIIAAHNFGTLLHIDNQNEFNLQQGSTFITLDYFEGTSLYDYPSIDDEEKIREIIKQICSVLFYLHQSNFIHFDVKPENILIHKDGKHPVIKFIDFGFTHRKDSEFEFTPRGTLEYIAPEMLLAGQADHRADLYSLGIILYRIIYHKFPFAVTTALDTLKAHLEKDFEFPENNYSAVLTSVVKRLLVKEPENRYQNSLEILDDLNIPTTQSLKQEWTPAKIFCNRKDVFAVVNSYVSSDAGGNLLSIRGTEGAGKSMLLQKLYFENPNAIIIHLSDAAEEHLWKRLLRNIIFNEAVYKKADSQLINEILNLLEDSAPIEIDKLKSLIARISLTAKFIILLDDFNRYDSFTLDLFEQLFPILLVNNIRIITAEDTGLPYISNSFQNVLTLNLTPFTEANVNEYLEINYWDKFPRGEIKKLILLYADLLPGNIASFIKDLILLELLSFNRDGAFLNYDKDSEKLLKSSQEDIFILRLKDLDENETKAVQLLALFQTGIDENLLALLVSFPAAAVTGIISGLREKNILQPINLSLQPKFISESIKQFIYERIENKKPIHLFAAKHILNHFPEFYPAEIARQFELAGEYRLSFNIYKKELQRAEQMSASTYERKILEHLIEFPLDDEDKFYVKFRLSKVLFRIGEKKLCLALTEELLPENLDKEILHELTFQKSLCLIGTGELNYGKELLLKLFPIINDDNKKQRILIEIANIYFDLNDFSSAEKICRQIIESKDSDKEIAAKAYNLEGLIEFYQDENLGGAITGFKKALELYKESNLAMQAAGIEVNIGNIYNIKGDYENAEQYWNNSLETNLSIGNIEQESKTVFNYGIYYFDHLNFEKSIEHYTRAHSIFRSLGDKHSQGLVLSNLGEVYHTICEYQKAYDSLTDSKKFFRELSNPGEEVEVLFMLGKFYYDIGDEHGMNEVIADFEKLLKNHQLTDKQKTNFKFLEILNFVQRSYRTNVWKDLTDIRDEYRKKDDKNNFIKASFVLSDVLMNLEAYPTALKELEDENFVAFSNQNPFFKAERNLLLGKISLINRHLNLPSPASFFEEAFEILQNEQISEVTWKVLLAMANLFYERGNPGRVKDFSGYAKSLIHFLAGRITNPVLQQKYLQKSERKAALERLEFLEQKINE
jgi:serine/threonine protein kinase